MIITALVENTSISEDLGSEHGLSLHIETGSRRVLFDVGASGLFLENAEKLGVRIADVDCLIISHGHSDHGGGLRTFFRENKKARRSCLRSPSGDTLPSDPMAGWSISGWKRI